MLLNVQKGFPIALERTVGDCAEPVFRGRIKPVSDAKQKRALIQCSGMDFPSIRCQRLRK